MSVEQQTGELFGSLWHRLTDEQYQESVDLFRKRFEANDFDLAWFEGKKCLDAGTGSGRYAVAMAMHGASEVIGVDVSTSGLDTARKRSAGITNLSFLEASVHNLPFPDASFDFVCCAGVLHHTTSISRGLDEITRVLRPDGKLFLLLYGYGGLRWRLIQALRPLADELGRDAVDIAITKAGLPANNRKHFMDDLFVPVLDLVKWNDLQRWLAQRGYKAHRWSRGQEFDHEANTDTQIADMKKLERIFMHGSGPLFEIGANVARVFIAGAQGQSKDIVIGEGLHRVLATRS